MRKFSFPAFLVVAASILILAAALRTMGAARGAAAALAAAQNEARLAQIRLAAVQRAAAVAKAGSQEAERFLQTWTAELQSEQNIEQVFGRLDTLAVDNLLSPSGKNFTLNKNYFFGGRHMAVQVVNINVAGEYPRTLNWLGAVEHAFPLARVEQIAYTTAGSSLAVAVQFAFPVEFDAKEAK